ncbi:MAG: response regulator transcription factor [Bacteroidales bacterium]|nr:response regulator transcription factor [Bacteroidales bacterium]
MSVTGKIHYSEDLSQIEKSNADYIFVDTGLPDVQDLYKQVRSGHAEGWPVLIALTHHRKDKNLLSSGLFRHSLDLSQPKSEILHSLVEITKNNFSPNKASVREEKLSEREKSILRFVALGYTNKEIAEKLFISMHTVITHRKNITRKLGIKTVSGLTVYAILNQLIDMNSMG